MWETDENGNLKKGGIKKNCNVSTATH